MKKFFISAFSFLMPLFAFAQSTPSTTYITGASNIVKDLIRTAFVIIPAIGILFFFWELIKYIRSTPDEKAKNRSMLLWSILALFIIFSAMGIIRVIQGVTGTSGSQQIQTSQVPSIVF